MGWDPCRPGKAGPWPWAQNKNSQDFSTGTGLVDTVRDGKFPGNSLMGTGENQKSGLLEAAGPGILALTLPPPPQKKTKNNKKDNYKMK